MLSSRLVVGLEKHSGEVIWIVTITMMTMMRIFLTILVIMPSLPAEISSSDQMIEVSNRCHELISGPMDHDRLIQCLRTGFKQLALELQRAKEMAIKQGKSESIHIISSTCTFIHKLLWTWKKAWPRLTPKSRLCLSCKYF